MTIKLALDRYRELHAGLIDMIEGGRLNEGHIPDDFQWLQTMLQPIPELPEQATPEDIERATDLYCGDSECDHEIDDDAVISEAGKDGNWISAWLWLPSYEEENDDETE